MKNRKPYSKMTLVLAEKLLIIPIGLSNDVKITQD